MSGAAEERGNVCRAKVEKLIYKLALAAKQTKGFELTKMWQLAMRVEDKRLG